MKRAITYIFLWVLWAPTLAVAASKSAVLADAMDKVTARDWPAAITLVEEQDQVTRDIINWYALRGGYGSFEAYRSFLQRRPDWPGLPLLREAGERSIPINTPPSDVISYFAGQLPRTGAGSLRLAQALYEIGAPPIAADEVRRGWLTLALTKSEQATFVSLHGPSLESLHEARLDALLWEGKLGQASEMLDLVKDTPKALAKARLALLRGEVGVDQLIEAVPPQAAADPGLAHSRFVWRMRERRYDDAETLLLQQSTRPDGLGRPAEWGRSRERLARRALQQGRAGRAYLIASTHGLKTGQRYASLEWLAGYIALTKLDDASAAAAHFRRFRIDVFTPISLGRAGYWEGRALEAMGRPAEAQDAYAFGAEFQTSFYGQLAALRLGLPMDPALVGNENYPPLDATPLVSSSVLEAALTLHQAGQKDTYRRFLRHLAEAATPLEQGTLGQLAIDMGEPFTALHIAKYAASLGEVIPRPYFPIPDDMPEKLAVAPELALAIMRRESEFNAGAISHAGARGLMQLMPKTGQLVAKDLDITLSTSDLTEDPALNIRLGTTYLSTLDKKLDGYLPGIAAGYNAGPGRAVRWISAFGDPTTSVEAAVDWIEAIPFDETRNYVMRVLESREVYRARLAGKPVEWSLGKALTGS